MPKLPGEDGMLDALSVLKQHWSIILTLSGLLATAFWLKLDSRYAKKTDIAELKKNINQNKSDVQAIKNELQHIPSPKDITDLRLVVAEMKGESRLLRSEIKGLSHQVGLLLEKEIKSNE